MKKGIRIVLLGMILVLGGLLFFQLYGRKKTDDSYKELSRQITAPVTGKETIKKEKVDDAVKDWYETYGIQVDFKELEKINQDIVGWIKFDELEIDYPILLGEDNEQYLRSDYQGKSATQGSIFMDSENRGDFHEYHIILYGHNMRNGSMFGQLKKYKEKEFYDGNEYFTIYTKEYVLRYQIFSCHDTDAYGSVYTVGFAEDETYQQYIENLTHASWYPCPVDVKASDQIVTLSTCTTNSENRFVVHGKLIQVLDNNQ